MQTRASTLYGVGQYSVAGYTGNESIEPWDEQRTGKLVTRQTRRGKCGGNLAQTTWLFGHSLA